MRSGFKNVNAYAGSGIDVDNEYDNIYDLVLTTYNYVNDNIIELPLNNFKP